VRDLREDFMSGGNLFAHIDQAQKVKMLREIIQGKQIVGRR